MWNRVLLLAAGVAFGWTLVHLLTVPPGQVVTHRLRLVLALVVGLGLIALLAAASLQAGLAGFLVFTVSALVAYAANAKQVSRAPAPVLPGRPVMPPQADPRTQILIVTHGEPATYEGPQYWALAYRQRQERGERIPHWFIRPLAYDRIRQAYAAIAGLHPLDLALSEVSEALQTELGPGFAVRHAYLYSHPYMVRALVALAEEGFRRVVVVPLDIATGDDSALRQAVADSRVREIGMQIAYSAIPKDLPGQPALYADHLSRLDHGHALVIPPHVTSDQVQDLVHLVLRAVEGMKAS